MKKDFTIGERGLLLGELLFVIIKNKNVARFAHVSATSVHPAQLLPATTTRPLALPGNPNPHTPTK